MTGNQCPRKPYSEANQAFSGLIDIYLAKEMLFAVPMGGQCVTMPCAISQSTASRTPSSEL